MASGIGGQLIAQTDESGDGAHHPNQDLFGEERLMDVIRHDYGPDEPRDDVAVVVLRIES